jgi:hypothetical protein
MHTPDGRRDFLKQLAAMAGGFYGMSGLTRPGMDPGHAGVADHVGEAWTAVALRRPTPSRAFR